MIIFPDKWYVLLRNRRTVVGVRRRWAARGKSAVSDVPPHQLITFVCEYHSLSCTRSLAYLNELASTQNNQRLRRISCLPRYPLFPFAGWRYTCLLALVTPTISRLLSNSEIKIFYWFNRLDKAVVIRLLVMLNNAEEVPYHDLGKYLQTFVLLVGYHLRTLVCPPPGI